IEGTQKIWALYDEAAGRVGYTPGPENRGYLLRVHVSDSHEKAERNAREFLWMSGEFTGLAHPVWSNPAGYGSPNNRRAFVEVAAGRKLNPRAAPYEVQRQIMEATRPGIFAFWGNDGHVSHEDSMTCIRLIGQEVMPAVREIGKELG